MARLFPYQKPEYGLSFSRHAVSLLKQQAAWRRATPLFDKSYEHALSPNVLYPTYHNQNIKNSEELVKELCKIRNTSDPTTIALTLPNLCAQIELFECEAFPSKHEEQKAFLQWRFQEQSPVPLGPQTIVFHYATPNSSLKYKSALNVTTPRKILAASIRTDILQTYEEICDRAGFIPIKIGLSAIELFNLFQPSFHWEQECFFGCFEEECFLIFGFSNGRVNFVRMKKVTHDSKVLVQEIQRTLQIYENTRFQNSTDQQRIISPFYFLSDIDIQWRENSPSQRVETDHPILFPSGHKNWGVQPISCLDKLYRPSPSTMLLKDTSLVTLSAWAGLQ